MTGMPTLIQVRFTTARSGLCGCHLSGMVYDVPADFALQVVERERCAEYVQSTPAALEAGGRASRKRA